MSKRVLVLSSSPRKGGNSETLCDEFIKGAKEAGNRVDKVSVARKKIGYCTGCGACSSEKSAGRCVQKDDMAGILEKMLEAQVIVLATPVYFYSMCAQMKALIDRSVARWTELKDKEFYFIVTAAEDKKASLERTIEGLRGFLDCLDGAQEKGIVYGTGAWEIGAIAGSRAIKQAYDMGKKA
jgi:multimeric flavodoxin WrbA